MASNGEWEEGEKDQTGYLKNSAIRQRFDSAPNMDVFSRSFQNEAYFRVEQRTEFFLVGKRGEEVKRANTTSHSIKNIELFIFEGIPGPFYNVVDSVRGTVDRIRGRSSRDQPVNKGFSVFFPDYRSEGNARPPNEGSKREGEKS